jgi:hypothetical protein
MQTAYQSEDPDDTSSYDATTSSNAGEEEESEEEESGSHVTDADVNRQPDTEVENQ